VVVLLAGAFRERLHGLWGGRQPRTAEAVQVVADGDHCGGIGVALFGECFADGVAGVIEVSGGGAGGGLGDAFGSVLVGGEPFLEVPP
jgi:hypothetical protein